MKARQVLLGLVVAATGGLVIWASLGGGPAAPPVAPSGPTPLPGVPAAGPGPAVPADRGPTFSSPADCRACHAEIYEEWAASMHAKAWTDPEPRSLSDDFKSTECLSCHAPQPIHGAPIGGRVFERASRFETGVDCLSCHLLPDGGVAAVRDVPGAPCRPRRVETLHEPVNCKGCHNQHFMVDEWETLFHRPDPAKGALLEKGRPENCVDCHMPPVTRAGKAGHSHSFPGGHDADMLRMAMQLAARVEKGEVVAETTNAGAGHKAPADSRHRSFNVWVTVTTEGGVKIHDRAEIAEYRMYYRQDFRENTNLRPGETHASRLALPQGVKGKVLVELVFALNLVRKGRRDVIPVRQVEIEFDTR